MEGIQKHTWISPKTETETGCGHEEKQKTLRNGALVFTKSERFWFNDVQCILLTKMTSPFRTLEKTQEQAEWSLSISKISKWRPLLRWPLDFIPMKNPIAVSF